MDCQLTEHWKGFTSIYLCLDIYHRNFICLFKKILITFKFVYSFINAQFAKIIFAHSMMRCCINKCLCYLLLVYVRNTHFCDCSSCQIHLVFSTAWFWQRTGFPYIHSDTLDSQQEHNGSWRQPCIHIKFSKKAKEYASTINNSAFLLHWTYLEISFETPQYTKNLSDSTGPAGKHQDTRQTWSNKPLLHRCWVFIHKDKSGYMLTPHNYDNYYPIRYNIILNAYVLLSLCHGEILMVYITNSNYSYYVLKVL